MAAAAMNHNSLRFLHIGDGAARRGIAVRAQAGAAPRLFWLGGHKTDMKGTQAVGRGRPAVWGGGGGRGGDAVGSTFPATASQKARSPTAPSAAGSPTASPCSMPAARGR